MAETSRQKRITGRVMHEFKHGERTCEKAKRRRVQGRLEIDQAPAEDALVLAER